MPILRQARLRIGGTLAPRSNPTFFLTLLLISFSLSILQAQTVSVRPSAEIDGRVIDSSRKPIAGASVFLYEEGESPTAETKTNDQGIFVFSSLPAGSFAVKAEKPGFRNTIKKFVQVSLAEKDHCELLLVPEPETSPGSANASSTAISGIQFDDRTNFTVAGISDSAESGGHGSETRMRTGDVLAKETLNLKSGESSESSAAIPQETLFRIRQHLQEQMASEKNLSHKHEADIRRSLGDVEEKLADPLAAEREYKQATLLDPTEQNYFSWGAELLLHRATAPAVEVFGQGAHLHPDSFRMLAGLGAALYEGGSAEDAARRLCEASELQPLNPAPYLFLGRMQESSSTPLDCAEEKLARFVRHQPANAKANYYYALALWKRGRGTANVSALTDAEAWFGKASTLDPSFAAAFLQLGNLKFELKDFKQAIVNYQKAIAANPAGSEAHYRLGLAYKRNGEDAEAQKEFDAYKRLEQTETALVEQQSRQMRQFLFVIDDQASDDQASKDQASKDTSLK